MSTKVVKIPEASMSTDTTKIPGNNPIKQQRRRSVSRSYKKLAITFDLGTNPDIDTFLAGNACKDLISSANLLGIEAKSYRHTFLEDGRKVDVPIRWKFTKLGKGDGNGDEWKIISLLKGTHPRQEKEQEVFSLSGLEIIEKLKTSKKNTSVKEAIEKVIVGLKPTKTPEVYNSAYVVLTISQIPPYRSKSVPRKSENQANNNPTSPKTTATLPAKKKTVKKTPNKNENEGKGNKPTNKGDDKKKKKEGGKNKENTTATQGDNKVDTNVVNKVANKVDTDI